MIPDSALDTVITIPFDARYLRGRADAATTALLHEQDFWGEITSDVA